MDTSQLLPKKKSSLQPKNFRFLVVMKYFTIISLTCVLFYALLFAILSVWQMTLVCGITAAFWGGIFLINRRGMIKIAFLAGVAVSAIFSLLSSWLLGWDSGFFLLALLILPVIFYPSQLHFAVKIGLAAFVAAMVLTLFILSWSASSFWVLSQDFLHLLGTINLVIVVIVLSLTGYFFVTVTSDAEKALIQTNKKLASLSSTDPVTNLVNRRIILSRIEQERNRMQRGNKPFTLIMMDVDHFKVINDNYGYAYGDIVMAHLAGIISKSLRMQDEVARWGGDEFLILLPETDIEGGKIVAEKIRGNVIESPYRDQDKELKITVTLGVGQCDKENGVGSYIHKVDHALFLGKQAGRNRVSIFQEQ